MFALVLFHKRIIFFALSTDQAFVASEASSIWEARVAFQTVNRYRALNELVVVQFRSLVSSLRYN